MAEHHPVFSHDAINRYLMEDDVSPSTAWAAVRDAIRYSKNPYKAVADLDWFDDEKLRGKLVKMKGFPKDKKVKLFWVADENRTECVVTNDLPQDSSVVVKTVCKVRWKVETAFQHVEKHFNSEIETLAYPKAALLGFALALVAYNMFSVMTTALDCAHENPCPSKIAYSAE